MFYSLSQEIIDTVIVNFMKNFSLWVFSALMGLLLIFLLNTSPLSKLGFGLEIPAGWETNAVRPETTCPDIRLPNEGIPFANERQGTSCATDSNRYAVLMNGLSGIGMGLLYSAIAHKYWGKSGIL
jgi:hypothetical protein